MEKIFWLDGYTGQGGTGGIFYRSFDFNKFVDEVEEKEGKVVGLKYEGNNVELILEVV